MATASDQADPVDLGAALLVNQSMRDRDLAITKLLDHGPLYYSELMQAWILTRYADVAAAFRNYKDFSAEGRFSLGLSALVDEEARQRAESLGSAFDENSILFLDPPRHTQLRRVMQPMFHPSRIEQFRGIVLATVTRLLDAAQRGGAMDFAADFTKPLPQIVVAEFLGVDTAHAEQLAEWGDRFFRPIRNPMTDLAGVESAQNALDEMQTFLEREVDRRRRESSRTDVIGMLVKAQDEDGLTWDEVLFTFAQLAIAGTESTDALLGLMLLQMLLHPHEYERFCADPAQHVGGATEETLRYDGPTVMMSRIATRDLDLHGQTIPQGASVLLCVPSANRDPAQFEDPERYDITRSIKSHLTFGFGHHLCVGAALSRMEVHVAMPEVARRFPTMRLASDEYTWDTPYLRKLTSLPVEW